MTKTQTPKPTRHSFSVLHQLCNFIPPHLVPRLAREYGVDKQSRDITPWSHVVALLFSQLTRSIGLRDVCDALAHHPSLLAAIRGAGPPSRSGLSNANKVRDWRMAQKLFYAVADHLHRICPRFGGRTFGGYPRRFRRAIHVADATVIQLVMNSFDWAKHRRRKAAAKLHLRLDLQSFLPRFAIIDTARVHEAKRARELCAGARAGEIVIFDKAYLEFAHLAELTGRGVFWVMRAKDNTSLLVVKRLLKKPKGAILRDDIVVFRHPASKAAYPMRLRRVRALVEVRGEMVEMDFLTNNLDWAPSTIAELYRCRWAIETFFRQIKQTLNLCDFLGYSANAVKWQVWTALLLYMLLRFQGFVSRWEHSFTRLYAMVRGVLWDRFDLRDLLDFYGTAGARFRFRAAPQQAYLPGFT